MAGQILRYLTQLLICAALFLGACSSEKDSQAYLDDARSLLQSGDRNGAIVQLKNVLQQDPDSVQARLLLGTIYLEEEQYDEAEKELSKARSLGGDEAVIAPKLATVLLSLNQYQRLLDGVQNPVDAPPAVQAAVLVRRGRALVELNQLDDATAAFDQAVQTVPDFAEAYLGYALIEIRGGNLQQALSNVERMLSQMPDSRDALILKGDLLAALEQPEPSHASYEQAVRVAPKNLQARLRLVSSYLAAGNIEAAATAVEQARNIAPRNVLALHMQALVEFRQGHLQAALRQINLVMEVAPDFPPANMLAGSLEYENGDYDLARKHLNVVVNKIPSNVTARKLLAATELKLGNHAEAEDLLQVLDPDNTEDRGVLGLLAEIYLDKNDYSAAGVYLERSLRVAPDDPKLRTAIAVNQLRQGNTERAVAELESIAAKDNGYLQADTALILVYLDAKEYDKALAAIDKLDEKLFGNPLIHSVRGLVYLGKKDEAQARVSFERALALQATYFPAAANLAQLDIKAGDTASAKARFDNILKVDENNVQAMLALAQLAFGDKDEKAYVSWLQRAAEAAPGAPQPLALLSRYHLSKGDKDTALSIAQESAHANPENPQALV